MAVACLHMVGNFSVTIDILIDDHGDTGDSDSESSTHRNVIHTI